MRVRAGTIICSSGRAVGQIEGADGQAEAVGGGQGEAAVGEPQQDAGQDGAGVVGCGGEDDLVDGFLQDVGGDAKLGAATYGGHGREIVGVDAGDVGLVATARQVDLVGLGVEVELDLLAVVEQGDIIGEQPGRQGDLALVGDGGRDAVGDRELEVVGGQLELHLAGREEDVTQHGQRALGRHDSPDDGEALGQVFLQALELHGQAMVGNGGWQDQAPGRAGMTITGDVVMTGEGLRPRQSDRRGERRRLR